MALICLPCEIQHRELDAKLLLAVRLCSSYGHHCLIGYDKYFNEVISELGPVVLLDKSMSSIMLEARIKKVKKNNGYVAVSDEEGINDLAETPLSFITRLNSQEWDSIDVYCCWGKFDYNFFVKHCSAPSEKLVNIGNCRSDLLNGVGKSFYRNTALSINNIFGKFILVSDNFSVDHLHKNYCPPRFDNVDSSQFAARMQEWDWQLKTHQIRRDKLSQLIDEILAAGKINILIRPHPVYDSLYWHQKYRKKDSVVVLMKHNADPWIHASNGVLSSGCTVGLQAVYAGKKSFHYDGDEANPSKSITKYLAINIKDSNELEEALQSTRLENGANQFFWNTSGSSTERIAELLASGADQLPKYPKQIKIRYLKSMVPLPPKWSRIELRSVIAKVEKWSSVVNAKCPSVAEASPGVYLLTPS